MRRNVAKLLVTCRCAAGLLPYSVPGRDVVPHVLDEDTHDWIGYFGDDPGDPVVAPAGSIACFSNTVLHRGEPNTTDHVRRVYLAQYSAEPILTADGSRPRHLAHPLVGSGRRP